MVNLGLIREGKTKNVYKRSDGLLEFHFKDDATGVYDVNGKQVFDPGCDVVVGKKQGKGALSCRISQYFFEKLNAKGLSTHYVQTIEPNIMVAREAEMLHPEGHNLEFIFRNKAFGSFLRRYEVAKRFQDLGGLIEITTKGEKDHLITEDILEELGYMNHGEITEAKNLTEYVNDALSKEFRQKGLYLIDGKIELGRLKGDKKIFLIDDLSFDIMRVCEGDGTKEGKVLEEAEIIERFGF